jgi:hypothetical protein
MVKKLRRVEIQQLGDLQQALSLAADSIEAARNFARGVDEQANKAVEDMRTTLQKHLDRKDLRPHVIFKPHARHVWSVSFNDVVYSLGPNIELDTDDEAMNFWWQRGTEQPRSCKSLFMGLMAIVMDYCNVDEAHEEQRKGSLSADTNTVLQQPDLQSDTTANVLS